MEFDSADVDQQIADNKWEYTILHEMAHVIGFGGSWGYDYLGTVYNDVYVDGSGQYTGAAALAAYQAEFDATATYVPVELQGGAGPANSHWDEEDGERYTGITDNDGNDMVFELMTGWLNSQTFVSNTTIAQFYDIGYTVVPEPNTILLAGLALLVVRVIRRFHQNER